MEGTRHQEVALRRRQGFRVHAYSVAPFALPVLAVALVAPGRSLSAEGGTPRLRGASALARLRWLEVAKGKVSGDSCEPHPFPTWLRRPGEQHRPPVPVANAVGSGCRGSGWWCLHDSRRLGLGEGENRTKDTWEPNASPFLLCRFFHSFYSFVLHLCAERLLRVRLHSRQWSQEYGRFKTSVALGSGDAGVALHVVVMERGCRTCHDCSRESETEGSMSSRPALAT